MIVIAAALLASSLLAVPQTAVPQPSTPTAPTWTPEQLEGIREKEAEIQKQREPARQQAIHINDLAGNIHSEAEARAYVDAVAEVLTGHRHMLWTTRSIRRRVAHAEYEAVTDPARQIPEQRIVDVWNEYVREIDAPAEALVTVAELHNLRDSMYVGASRFAWKREINQSIWTMPNIYALDADGKIASGCRALETLKIIHDMHDQFQNVRWARARIAKGLLASDIVKLPNPNPEQRPQPKFAAAGLRAVPMNNPIPAAMLHYQQEHGEHAYQQLLQRLFAELFPED
jgi:hypothetical protein